MHRKKSKRTTEKMTLDKPRAVLTPLPDIVSIRPTKRIPRTDQGSIHQWPSLLDGDWKQLCLVNRLSIGRSTYFKCISLFCGSRYKCQHTRAGTRDGKGPKKFVRRLKVCTRGKLGFYMRFKVADRSPKISLKRGRLEQTSE